MPCLDPFFERDVRLVEAWKRGDRNALATLFEHYEEFFHSVFGGKVEHLSEAKSELRQETHFQMIVALDKYGLKSSFRGLYRRVLRTVLRKNRRRKPQRLLDVIEERLAASEPSPVDLQASRERRDALLECRERLREDLKRALIEHYDHQIRVKLLAERFGISESNLGVQLHRARRLMRECMESKGYRDAL
ncbi:MAG: sigma-70 family RNA polymerase sigma factor [Planctomycetes bacterium]|nr:sigma-70 family RNA polymerase sigma factor [Planctomycetota bacterium]